MPPPLFFTDFSTDSHPYYDCPYWGGWPNGGRCYEQTWVSSDSRIWGATGASVWPGLGKGGKNGLWAAIDPDVSGYTPDDSWVYWALNQNPALRDGAMAPVEYAGAGEIAFSVQLRPEFYGPYGGTSWYNYGDEINLISLYDAELNQALRIFLYNDGYAPDNNAWYYEIDWHSPEWPAYELIAAPDFMTLADGSWRDFVVRYQPSTVLGPFVPGSAPPVAPDGSIDITINGVTLMSRSGLYLCLNKYGYGPNGYPDRQEQYLNRVSYIGVGSGIGGYYDSISYGMPAPPSPSPSRSPSASRSRSLSPSPSVSPSPAPESISPHPLVWVEWEPGDGSVRGMAEVTLPDPAGYGGGLKRARLLNVSQIRRALSGPHGDYESGRFDVTLADTDRVVRGVLGSAPTSYWTRRPMRVQLIDDASRRQLRTPRLIAVGSVESPTFTDSEVTLRAVDAVGAQRWMDAKSG